MRRLYRDESKGMIAGVAAGMADYFQVDPVFVRLGFVLAGLANGLGVVAYLVCWVIVPERGDATVAGTDEPPGDDAGGPPAQDRPGGRVALGIVLIAAGAFLLLERFDWFFLPTWATLRNLWPLILVAAGVGLLLDALRRTSR